MQRLAPLLASFVVLGFASGAEANRLSIEFDFTNSVLTFSGISIPPSGGFTSAGAILIIPSNGSTSVQNGPATLRSWRFNGTVDHPFGFFSVIEGTFTLTQLGSAYGTFDAAGGTAFISQDLNVFFGLYSSYTTVVRGD